MTRGTNRRFLVVSGLPGSGKSTLARRLVSGLGLPLLDKDDFLERLYGAEGIGNADWRSTLSRRSDRLLQAEAAASQGAILVSHWRLPGMPPESGTPVDWIAPLSTRIVTMHCECSVELSAERFGSRQRHPGHLDGTKVYADILEGNRRLSLLPRLALGTQLIVNTSEEPDVDLVLRQIGEAFDGFR